MSELLSDVKAVLKERVSGPFFGYIFLSFFLFNWDWIYFFIFSNLSAEQKLSSIGNTYQYTRGFVYPIISGFTMCLAGPFINVFIKKLHSIAVRISKEIDYDNDNSLEAIKADRELKNSLKRQKASIIKSDVDKLEKDHQTLHESTLAMRSEVATLTARRLELLQTEQELNQKINEITIELQEKNATKDNFSRLNDMIEEKSNENIKLSSKINNIETMLVDISKYIETKDGSRIESILLNHKVESFLGSYGYNKGKTKEQKEQPGLGEAWKTGLLGINALNSNPIMKSWGVGALNTNPMNKDWRMDTINRISELKGSSIFNEMPAIKEAAKLSRMGDLGLTIKAYESSGLKEATQLAKSLDIFGKRNNSEQLDYEVAKSDDEENKPSKQQHRK
ncbi:hypothetical protein [Serratia marcescens]|uniref:hypothetical protein n=1 Tax=Serratia marcescens TaxID=615 RepID=UPI000D027B85|nr:hypothetical protein [Serratia marcescens]AVN50852.1 hypothetical protein AM478_14450 [Serratia marcescens]EGT0059331.1 hypothetical protein [Serratia marcescens]MBH2619871.1 hypothetical protein [Serratia marcescens]